MSLDKTKNFCYVTLSTGYNSAATSVVLVSGDGAKLPTVSFNLVWYNSTDYPEIELDTLKEIIRVTVISTDTLTISRAQEGTTAQDHNISGKVYKMSMELTSKMITDIDTFITSKGQADGLCDLDGSTLTPLNRIPTTLTGKDADTVDTYHAISLEKTANREAVSGYAGLDANQKVIKDPANATATPTASKIPISDGSGKLDGWVTANPSKATGAELDTGTDDAKFATALALKNSHNVPSVVPSTSGKILTSDGTDWISSDPVITASNTVTFTNKTLTDPKIVTSINAQTGTTYTLVLTDASKLITFDNAAAIAVTIPTNASVAFPIGTQIDCIQILAGKVTFSGASVTINSKGSNKSIGGQWVGVTLIKTATDTWSLLGDLIA